MHAIEDDPLHVARNARFIDEAVVIAMIERGLSVGAKVAEPAEHIRPGKQNGHRDRLVSGIFCVPAINRNRIAALTIVVGKYGRKLLEGHVRRKLLPAVVVPGFWVKRVIVTRVCWVIPFP